MFALLSDQGAACAETALCETCFEETDNQGYASEQGAQSGDIPDPLTFANCSGDTMLFCCICDENECGEKLKK